MRQIRATLEHCLGRRPIRPLGSARDMHMARPAEAVAPDADTVAKGLAIAEREMRYLDFVSTVIEPADAPVESSTVAFVGGALIATSPGKPAGWGLAGSAGTKNRLDGKGRSCASAVPAPKDNIETERVNVRNFSMTYPRLKNAAHS